MNADDWKRSPLNLCNTALLFLAFISV
ncbi:uncharacterized protein METZ01_LOCUS299973, partial [marine metagenome]